MSFSNVLWLPFGAEFKTYSDTLGNERFNVGQMMILPDGRAFRLARVGGVTLVAGTLVQSSVPVTNHIGQTVVTATSAGATSIAMTLGATPMDYDYYGGGVVTDESGGTGVGFSYPIPWSRLQPNNPLANAAASAAISIPLQTGYSVQAAINTSDVLSLIANPWKYVVINTTTQTAPCAGVALVAATTAGTINTTGGNPKGTAMGQLTWVQTAGLCPVRTDNTTVVAGHPVIASTVTAGDVSLITTTNIITSPIVGQCVRVAASGAWSTVNLAIENI